MRVRLSVAALLTIGVAGCGGGGGTEVAAGPTCPSLTQAQFAALGRSPEEASTLGGTVIRRQYGRATCSETGGGVRCDLSTPGLVHVTAGGTDAYFDVPASTPATVTVDGAEARCVVTPRPA